MTAAIHSGDVQLSAAQVDDLVNRCAASLRASGVQPGDAVAVMLRNEARWPVLLKAVRHIGAYAVPLNWHFRAQEAGAILRDCGAVMLFIHDDLLAQLQPAVPPATGVVRLAMPEALKTDYALGTASVPDAGTSWDDWLLPQADPVPPHPPRSSMSYTSGTTGQPKGVRREAMTPVHQQRVAEVNQVAFGLGPGARTLVLTPLYHSAPNVYALNALLLGDLLVLEPRFDARRTLALIERHRITHLYLVPTLMHRLLKLDPAERAAHDLSSLRFVLHGAAPCPAQVKRAMIDWWGPVIHEFYGGGEAGPVAAIGSADWLRKPGSVGRLVPHARVLIADAEGRSLPAGRTGTIYLEQAAYPPFTYHGRPDLRAACSHPRDPSLFTLGDMGWMDEDGYLFLSDRAKDMVISGGVNIYPAEIEAALAGMPGVQDCAVFGIPDEEFGESLLAVVQPEPGAGVTASGVQGWLHERLAGFKVPRRVEFVESLPREESGKIFKRRLREPYWRAAGRAI